MESSRLLQKVCQACLPPTFKGFNLENRPLKMLPAFLGTAPTQSSLGALKLLLYPPSYPRGWSMLVTDARDPQRSVSHG